MSKQLFSVIGNSQKLDGGAMFGNVPKAMWEKWVQVDELNRIDLGCRALLIKDGSKNILLETGIGAFFEPKLKQRFGVVEQEHVLLDSLQQIGLSHEDIDIVILSHLHFDHAGGLLSAWQEGKEPELLFPNAQFITGREHWERAQAPHFRDRASFLPALNKLLEQSGRLHLVDGRHCDILTEDYSFSISEGHTPGMLLTEVKLQDASVTFAADLIPGVPWVHLPVTMGYDRFPEHLIEEKQNLLQQLHEQQNWLFFTHDIHTAMAQIGRDEKGRFVAQQEQKELQAFVS
ncbi:MBL fold metallo-hydrolase [Pleionea sp. CnH1-48]|uniref:MBL fold metallo-hydrolase n=1 Tax=Pleionea sp. CnH1-48 TaxID=2954494 RepID=UPI0020983903|nr:MBL fold metallo-hydrolase [Pleionea sp. CnH1-48]MCO7227261.1 MBL fold metallo-hydrolase [Pleionea sp. CnH1-48]